MQRTSSAWAAAVARAASSGVVSGLNAMPDAEPVLPRGCRDGGDVGGGLDVERDGVGAGTGELLEVVRGVVHHQVTVDHSARVVDRGRDRPQDHGARSSPAGRSARRRTSKWNTRQPAARSSSICSPRRRKSAAYRDGSTSTPSGSIRSTARRDPRPGLSRHGQTRDEEAARPVHVWQRLEELRAEPGGGTRASSSPSVGSIRTPPSATAASTIASDSSALIVHVEYTTVPPRLVRSNRRPQQLDLEPRQWLGAPAEVGPGGEDAETGARRVDERPVEAVEVGRELAAVRLDDPSRPRRRAGGHSPRAARHGLRRPPPRRRRRRASSPCRPARRRDRACARPAASRRRARRAARRGSAATCGPPPARSRRPVRRPRRRESTDPRVPRSRRERAGPPSRPPRSAPPSAPARRRHRARATTSPPPSPDTSDAAPPRSRSPRGAPRRGCERPPPAGGGPRW